MEYNVENVRGAPYVNEYQENEGIYQNVVVANSLDELKDKVTSGDYRPRSVVWDRHVYMWRTDEGTFFRFIHLNAEPVTTTTDLDIDDIEHLIFENDVGSDIADYLDSHGYLDDIKKDYVEDTSIDELLGNKNSRDVKKWVLEYLEDNL